MPDRPTSLPEFVNAFFQALFKAPIGKEERLAAQSFFDELKKEIVSQVLEHPISQELINHSAPSQTLGISGSLFGFLGLIAGSDPMSVITEIIDRTMNFKLSRRLIKGGYKVTVTIPTKEDFRVPELLLPWESGIGLVEGIEGGVSGLSNFITQTSAASRSNEGVQTGNKIRQKEFGGAPWITPILNSVKNLAKTFR